VVNFYMALNHEKQATGQLDDFKIPKAFPGLGLNSNKIQMQV